MITANPYVVLLPGGSANPTDRHLVVRVREYVAIHLGEQEHYVFASQHDTYDSAADERNQLNGRPGDSIPCPPPTTVPVVLTKAART